MKKFYSLVEGGIFKFLFIAIIMLGSCPAAFSQPGVLDVTFGNGGKVITPIDTFSVAGGEMAIQPDGKILVAGVAQLPRNVFLVIRYNVDGSLDNSFGINGVAIHRIGFVERSQTIAIQKDGKILVGGFAGSINNSDMALVRYNNNGSIDSSFGTNGIVITDLGGREATYKILIKPDGKIIAAGLISGSEVIINLVQYTSAGMIDSTFGINGIAYSPQYSSSFSVGISDMAIKSDGKIVASGYIDGFEVYQFLPNGIIDSSFGNIGKANINFKGGANSVAIQRDGKIVLIGMTYVESSTQVGLARLNIDGSLDNSFGSGGKVITVIDTGRNEARGLYIQPDGKFLVSGSNSSAGVTPGFPYNVYNGNYILLRYNTDGTLDNTFGKHGIIKTDFTGLQDNALALAVQADGKIILSGRTSDSTRYKIGLARYEKNELTNYNTLNGSVFFDKNANNLKDADETFFNPVNIITSRPGFDTINTTSYGHFSIGIDTGTYNTAVVPYLPYYNVVPASHTASYTTYFNTDSVSFAVQPIPGKRDLAISIIPLTVARPGFHVQYKMLYRNPGTDTITNGTIRLVKNNKLNFSASFPAATSVIADTLTWGFSNFKPLDTASIIVDLLVQSPPAINNGDTLRSTVNILSLAADLTPNDNTSSVVQRVTGSYDPNDKSENHGGKLNVSQVINRDYLQYTVRFQNTGTDTAFNVYIHDTLSSKLDWSSFQMISSSHNYQLTIQKGGACSWAFSDINLADSNTNETLSHGYLVYRIKPKATILPKDTIHNLAAIFFDYNLPVLTNTEHTEIVSEVLPLTLLTFTAKKEGKENLLQWSTAQEVNVSYYEIQRGINGRDYKTLGKVAAGSVTYNFRDNNAAKATNYYRLKVMNKDGLFLYSPIRVIDNSSSLFTSIYPNPVKDRLTISFESDKYQSALLQLVSTDGKVVFSRQTSITTGLSIKFLPVAALQPGSYLIRITLSDKERTVLKFQKM